MSIDQERRQHWYAPVVHWPRVVANHRHWLLACCVTLALAFFVQGSRGLWEPDEGFYANVARDMSESGDWWVPKLNGQPFLDKPPLHVWGMAAGWRLIPGVWGLRLPNAVWFAAAALLTGALAQRLWGKRYGPRATLVYATMLLPFLAANIITPDTVLSFFVVAMAYLYWRWRSSRGAKQRLAWALATGCCAGLGILAKGPALLVFALPLLLHAVVSRRQVRFHWREFVLAGASAIVVGGSWYGWIFLDVPGAFAYIFDNQIAGRLWSSHLERNSSTWGALTTYGPVLIAGTLPWTATLTRAVRAAVSSLRKSGFKRLHTRPEALFVGLWVIAPLAVLCTARSRLPLYALPLMPAIALAIAATSSSAREQKTRWIRPRLLAIWLVLLALVKVAAVLMPTPRDSGVLAAQLSKSGVKYTTQLVLVDTKRNGLSVYGYRRLRWARFRDRPYPFFAPPTPLPDLLHSPRRDGDSLFLTNDDRAQDLLGFLGEQGEPCKVRNRFDDAVVIECGSSAHHATPTGSG